MFWQILKIEPTKDKRAITRAYRDLLTGVNPEEKPEEFKMLRNAYEEALAYAEQEEAPEGEKTPIDLWVDALNALYMDLGKRRDVQAWQELLSEEVCIALDTRPLIEEAMLHYFMEHFRIPNAVWRYLEEEFHFTEHEEDLQASYPPDFVRYVIMDGVTGNDSFPLELFPEGTDGAVADEYIRTYYQLTNTDFSEAGDLFERLAAIPARHPYGDGLRLRYDLANGDASAVDKMKELSDIYPDDVHLKIELAVCYYQGERFEEALALVEALMAQGEDNSTLIRIKAYSQARLENYKDALETLYKLMDLAGGNQRVIYDLEQTMTEWNKSLIASYEKQIEEGSEDPDVIYDLAWAYVQNELVEKAEALRPSLKENYPTEDKYLRLCFYILSRSGKTEEALNAVDRLIECMDKIESQDEEEKNKNEQRTMSIMVEKCQLLINSKQNSAASKVMAAIRERFFENPEAITRLTQLALQQKMYPEALESARRITQLLPDSYHGYMLSAIACFNMHRDNEAFSAINTALDLEGSDLYPYLLKLRILVRNDAFEPAQQLIDFLAENGITDDLTIEWSKACMMAAKEDDRQCEETNAEKAFGMYLEIEKKLEEAENKPEWVADFYYNMAVLRANIKDAKKDYTRADILEILDKGIAADPDSFDCTEYKAWLLRKEDRFDEALDLYHKLEKMPRNNHYIEAQLADMYSDDAYHSADTALEYYKIIEEDQGETRDFHQVVGYLHYVMKNFDLAEQSFNKALEYSPEDPWLYYRHTNNYQVSRKLNKALESAQKALELHRKAVDRDQARSFYWLEVARMLLLQNRVSEAIAVYEDCRKNCANYKSYWNNVVDALSTADRQKEVDNYMKLWKKSGEKEEDYLTQLVFREITAGNPKSALKLLKKYEKKMDRNEFVRLSAYAKACLDDFTEYVSLKDQALEQHKKPNAVGDLVNHYAGSAMAHWYNKDYKAAREIAEAGVKDAEKYDRIFSLYEPIHYGALSQCLAILGRFSEAREAVAKMQTCSLCESCRYHICKDFYLYSARIETIDGNYEEARRLMEQIRLADPAEEDRLVLEAYLETKGI